jgi:type II secretory pathway pseudopilin PulG
MKKIHYFVVFVLVVIGILFAFIIYSYNKNVEEEQFQHQQEINRIKQEQSRLNTQFEQQQQTQRQQQITAENEKAMQLKQDKDGDGLTYEQELKLGTSDDNPDSDGDGIRDNEDKHPAGGGEIYRITVPWSHNGQPYTTQFGIAEDWYWYYKNKPRDDYRYADARFVTYKDPVIQTIAKDITDTSISSGDPCKFCIAIDFVESMLYQKDIDYISLPDYPKYPIETIKDEKGDCEDTSFLMASILKSLNVDIVLLHYSDHMAVGFASTKCPGDSYTYQGGTYCFLETTSVPDNPRGDFSLWGKYINEKPSVIKVT